MVSSVKERPESISGQGKGNEELFAGFSSGSSEKVQAKSPGNSRTVLRECDGKEVVGEIVRVHYLACSVLNDKRKQCIDLLTRYFGECEDSKKQLQGWSNGLQFARGARFVYDMDIDTSVRIHNGYDHIILFGSTLDTLGPQALVDMHLELFMLGAKCTRIDLAWDDYKWRVSIDQVQAAYRNGDIRRFRNGNRISPETKTDRGIEKKGDTFYVGSRSSEKFIRIYNKKLESKGVHDCIRWEVEFKGFRAETVFGRLVAGTPTVKVYAERIGEIIGGSIDFRSDNSNGQDGHIDRMDRSGWWQEIVDILGEVKLRGKTYKVEIDKTYKYMNKSISQALAVAWKHLGKVTFYEYIRKLVDKGELCLNLQNRERLRQAESSVTCIEYIGGDGEILLLDRAAYVT